MFIHWLFIVSIDLPSFDLQVYLPINNKVLTVSLSHVLPSEYTFTYLVLFIKLYLVIKLITILYYILVSNAIALIGHIILTLVLNNK